MGKSTIILITRVDPSFQSPMYFFLGDIFFLEICYVSVSLSRIFINLWTQKSIIFFFAHVTKVCFIFMLRNTECFLLMVCDRHVAICHILIMVMNHEPCIWLMMTGCWMSGIPVTLGQTCHIFSLPLSGSNQTNHFFCDILPMLKLARGDTFLNEMLVLAVAVLLMMIPFLLTLGSCSKIISTIMKSQRLSPLAHFSPYVALFCASGIITYL
ncbi:olfactory receptor 10AG1-like [Myotis myotis]|uniref:olfactory receptor 10AG1-like n=1 Tax=Myotis myotis TaxID=51298 RepID=UPI00174E4F43|nr:olfactory receptor 10AG1-like [Myotis myotis]